MIAFGTEEHRGSRTHTLPRAAFHDVAAVVAAALVGVLRRWRGHVRVSALVYLSLQSTPDALATVRPGVGGRLSR